MSSEYPTSLVWDSVQVTENTLVITEVKAIAQKQETQKLFQA